MAWKSSDTRWVSGCLAGNHGIPLNREAVLNKYVVSVVRHGQNTIPAAARQYPGMAANDRIASRQARAESSRFALPLCKEYNFTPYLAG